MVISPNLIIRLSQAIVRGALRDQRLNHFRHKFGQPHLDLACHAAFPMALTPDLLYRLWAHFRCDSHDQPLNIPWVAVADVLLSPFCQEVGFDLYEIDAQVRTPLLDQLKADPRFGPQRLQDLADFLLTYHPVAQFHGDDPDLRDLAQVQRWAALAQTDSPQVVHDLARTLAAVPGSDSGEWSRMATLLDRLTLPKGEGQTLRHYARAMAQLSQGEPQRAIDHLRQLPGGGRGPVKVAGVRLSIPEEMQPQLPSPPLITRRRWLHWAGWGMAGVAGTVLLSRDWSSAPSSDPEGPGPDLQQNIVAFPIEVVTVDAQGRETERQQAQVNGQRWQQGEDFALEVVDIPSGEFLMGSPEDEAERHSSEGPQRRVTISAFAMGRYPVTQAQWRFVAGLPRVNRDLEPDPANFKGDTRPVETVSWHEAEEFCDRLSNFLGTPCRLPSEAEWEYACRAGTTTPFHFGETITPELANYRGEIAYGNGPTGIYRSQTTPVGSFGVANAFGLYDMHGNVWEWCADHWHDNYEGAPADGTAWLSSDESSFRLLRGGAWFYDPQDCRSAYRNYNHPENRLNLIGFRVVCSASRALL